MSILKRFTEIGKTDVATVGGKGASLGEMTQIGVPVPPGFVIPTELYRLYHGNLDIPQELFEEIQALFTELELDRVAVRSSAIAEDSADTSWAGQFETILNVDSTGLVSAVYECWQSAKSDIVKDYAEHNKVSDEKLALAVVVQKMVSSDVSGVVFTKNPVSNDEGEIMIEACWGLGEMLVQGTITPDNYIVDKRTSAIKEKRISNQDKKMITTKKGTAVVNVYQTIRGEQKLSDEMIDELCKLSFKIEEHYGNAQDIEWALENDEIFIVQSRPVTT